MTRTFENSEHEKKGLFAFMGLGSDTPEEVRRAMMAWAETYVPDIIRTALCTGAMTAFGACETPSDRIDELVAWTRKMADDVDFTFELEGGTILIYMISSTGDLVCINKDDQ